VCAAVLAMAAGTTSESKQMVSVGLLLMMLSLGRTLLAMSIESDPAPRGASDDR
jgi:hypothetical protein